MIPSLAALQATKHVQGLACSIKRTNGDLPLVVLTVKGDLSEESEQAVRKVATLVHVEDFFVRSLHTQRCGASLESLQEARRNAGMLRMAKLRLIGRNSDPRCCHGKDRRYGLPSQLPMHSSVMGRTQKCVRLSLLPLHRRPGAGKAPQASTAATNAVGRAAMLPSWFGER